MNEHRREAGRFDGWVLAILLGAWGAALVRGVDGPIVLPDELVGIAIGRFLAARGAIPDLAVPAMPGTGSLLAPFARWLTASPAELLIVARAIQVLLFAALGPLALASTRVLMPRADRSTRALTALAATLYPPLVLHAHVAMTEAPTTAALMLSAWAIASIAGDRDHARAAVVGGLALGALPVLHLRGGVPAVAGGAVLAWLASRRGEPNLRAPAAAMLALALGTFAIGATLHHHVELHRPPTWPEVAARHDLAANLVQASSAKHAARLLGACAAQLVYVAAATLGIALVGVAPGLRALAATTRSRAPTGDLAACAVGGFAALTQLGTMAIAALFANGFGGEARTFAESLFVGRAHDAVILPTLLVGLSALVERRRGSARRWLVSLAIVTIASHLLLAWRASGGVSPRGINWVNLLGLFALAAPFGRADLRLLFAVTLGAGALLVVTARRWPRVTLASLALCFAGDAAFTSRRYFVAGGEFHEAHRVVIHAAEVAAAVAPRDAASCIAVDRAPRLHFDYFDLAFHRPGTRLVRFDASRETSLCDLALLAEPPSRPPSGDARRVVVENDGRSALWVLPGALLGRLSERDLLLPEPPDAPLGAAAMRSTLALVGAPRPPLVVLREGAPVTLLVQTGNPLGGAPWPNASSLGGGGHPVRLGARWLRPDGAVQLEGRSELPATLFPGESARLSLALPPPSTTAASLPPGPYRVSIGMLQEGVRWFADAGDPRIEVDVLLR